MAIRIRRHSDISRKVPSPSPSAPPSIESANSELRFRHPKGNDIDELFAWYRRDARWPFFTDITGPTPTLDRSGFVRYLRDDAAFRVGIFDERVVGFLLLTYIQPTIHVANLDFRFLDTITLSSSTAMTASFLRAMETLLRKEGITKSHIVTLADEQTRIRFLKSIGFRSEGRLRRHFFHRGMYCDLVVMGRLEE